MEQDKNTPTASGGKQQKVDFLIDRKQLEKLAAQAEKAVFLERELKENKKRLAVLEKRDAKLSMLAWLMLDTLNQKKELTSFRTARLMQIFRNPSLIGSSSRLSVLWKLFHSRISGKKFGEEYHVFQELVNLISSAISSLPETEEAPSKEISPLQG